MSKTAEEIIQFLSQNENNYVTIVNQSNNTAVGKPNLYLSDIPNKDFDSYLKLHVGNNVQPVRVWIERRIKNGTSSVKKGALAMEILPYNQMAQPATESNFPAVIQPIQAIPMKENNNMTIHGLGMAEIVKMQVNEEKLEVWKEKYSELKEDFVELKKDSKIFEIDNRELKTKLSTAESQKEMAVLAVKLENKSFFDSEAFSKLMENAPAMIGSLAQMKAGAGAIAAGALGSPVASDSKKEFFDYANDNLDDEQINYLGSVCHFIKNPAFVNALNQLIQQHNNAV
ncbi:MAG: hypothetical protein H7Z76_06020 [Methylotenera sp.]|nr:hypothetical protein [Flavobacterium sp.]